MERCEIILAGIGGQGLLLAGLILGDSAAIGEKKHAVQIESYAPLARGGASKSEIIISTNEIDYPKIQKADVLVALSKEALASSMNRVKPDGLIVLDSTVPLPGEDRRILHVPLTQIAVETTGKAFTVSIVALGLVARITGVVGITSILTSIGFRAPTGTEDINRKAAEAGYKTAENYLPSAKDVA
ncbi:MAG: 2-oxoacid:acceptor oxidoreductase family protein [Candidatus Eremiobacteraeota bacterium]|nr:2-oxoacid:acceptor oxidoreductase family protein [Candidatus Eremiobacteraeota bacterium]